MALSDEEKWILTENLKRQEKDEIAKVERGEEAGSGDFGAYHALLTGKNSEWVKIHAISDEDYLRSYVQQLSTFLPQKSALSVLDVGCGPGLLTEKIREGLSDARVTGIDISESAIKYGRRQFPKCEFSVVGVDEKMDLGRTFGLVHAREFYPFTRTADLEFHEKILAALAKHVSPDGALVLTLLSTNRSIAANSSALTPVLAKAGMTPLRRVALANAKLARLLPLALARCGTTALAKARGRSLVHFYVSRRPERTFGSAAISA